MDFEELTDDEWAQLSALLSSAPSSVVFRRGRPCAPPRTIANAVLWLLSTSQPWSKLPVCYPSPPTCRRRFNEWLTNGTLAEMTRRLTLVGRSFPNLTELLHTSEASQAKKIHSPFETAQPCIRWSSPETWQPSQQKENSVLLRSLGPMARIAFQLVPATDPEVCDVTAAQSKTTAASQPTVLTEKDDTHRRPNCTLGRESADFGQPVAGEATSRNCDTPHDSTLNSRRRTRWCPSHMRLHGLHGDGPHGYAIYVIAEAVRDSKYRASFEITGNSKRIERSGLIGPHFADVETAHQFALKRAHDWIRQHPWRY
ncbi:transposase [Paraburkholderia unamae]|uniref:Transposase n=1 Tax=Paraburkholderia unamae TaxID=219649 RepID=A0ACC6RXQ9_9BURK